MAGQSPVDLVIIGAGAAGLGATKAARALGLDVVTFEAMDRVGGRAFTCTEPFGFPWDAGCHWLHSASVNPFTKIADAEGFHYRTASMAWYTWANGRLNTVEEEAAVDAFIDSTLDAAMRCGREGIDIAMADVLDPDSPWANVIRYHINAEWGVDPRAASTLDFSRYRDTHENWPVEEGYGALVVRAASEVVADVELSTPVESVTWSGPGVRVTTPKGTVDATAAVITVSTGVLADEVIAFDPRLPDWKQEAFAAVPLGRANKIALKLEAEALGDVPEYGAAAPIGPGQMMGLHVRPFGRDMVDGYVGGPACVELEAAGETAMIEAASEALGMLMGSGLRRQIVASTATRWASEPYIRGAYAAAIPGQADRREALRQPLDDRLFFAGEATSPEFFTTCHGAWETGIAATREVARVLGREAPTPR
ncbi:MAG: flavin monoamine oxidase family protein [Thermomicrobiales bacterium]